MQTANQSALETINAKFAAGDISVEQYQELLATVAQLSTPVEQPVKSTKAAPTALSDPSRRASLSVQVSEDFTKGHLTIMKTRTNGQSYPVAGVWAEQVTDLIVALSERFEELPEAVREAASN